MRPETLTILPEQTEFPRLTPRGDVKPILDLLRRWQARASQRHHLASLDDRLLDDMGLGREDAIRESSKPFWWV